MLLVGLISEFPPRLTADVLDCSLLKAFWEPVFVLRVVSISVGKVRDLGSGSRVHMLSMDYRLS